MSKKVSAVRNALYAGSFYPSSKKELSTMIDSLLSKSAEKKLGGKLVALVVPHAGYVYSGIVAASAYRALKESAPKRIILIGPSHHDFIEGVFSFGGSWSTPLGEVCVHKSGLGVVENDCEHSLEVQLPFIQRIFPKINFEFVPLIYGECAPDFLAYACEELAEKDSVIIASSDLSHYLSYELAKKVDLKTINSILSLDLKNFLSEGDACGKTGIAALLLLAKKNKWRPVLLDYKNSGDTAGDKNSVVGYASIAFIK